MDLFILKDNKNLGFEFKYQDAPKLTPSMLIVMHDLEFDSLTVIYPGNISYALTKDIHVIGLQ
ncbi:hypothetical protein [Candidatus Jidaibacter acanthamoebae]|uniref:hypothetical protein n=1 Tax=Candidatus Jidaibacter acanthamoebae TaxID=86105 RepID=UPI00057C70F2|nr:hypothetical protein [Candidatus Jidaibacter acanthamoeba]